jgi:hypothetical protein
VRLEKKNQKQSAKDEKQSTSSSHMVQVQVHEPTSYFILCLSLILSLSSNSLLSSLFYICCKQ